MPKIAARSVGRRPDDLDGLVGGDAGAGQRRRVERVDAVGDGHDVGGVGDRVLGERRRRRRTRCCAALAQRLPAGDAVVAGAAGPAEPGNGDPVADRRVVTPAPSASTMPTPSCPGMNGGVGLTGQSPWAAWMSVWQSPEASIRTSTSPGPGSGSGTCVISSGWVKSSTTAARMSHSSVGVPAPTLLPADA